MKALSILQPWAWLIVRPDVTDPTARQVLRMTGLMKDVENRSWPSKFEGRFIVHAGKKWGREQREDLDDLRLLYPSIHFPASFDLGGIVGAAIAAPGLPNVVLKSRWHQPGCYGIPLSGQTPLPFIPYRGQLGWFEIPDELVTPYLEKP